MKFDLRLTNPRRVRWLLWVILSGYGLCLAVVVLIPDAAFWWLVTLPSLVLMLLPFWNQVLRQPAWVLVASDSVAWTNPADAPPIHYQFTELRAYRFESSRIDSRLLLYPKEGAKVVISGRLHQEFWAMEEAFKQAIKGYNQANPGAEVAQELDALTKFFTSPRATQVLWGLLALGALEVGWGISRNAPGVAYLPLLLIGLPYLLVWANFYYERP